MILSTFSPSFLKSSLEQKLNPMKSMIICARGFFLLMILLSFQHVIFGAEELKDGLYAKLETSRGEILLQLYHQRVPQTVANFVDWPKQPKPGRIRFPGNPRKHAFMTALAFTG